MNNSNTMKTSFSREIKQTNKKNGTSFQDDSMFQCKQILEDYSMENQSENVDEILQINKKDTKLNETPAQTYNLDDTFVIFNQILSK